MDIEGTPHKKNTIDLDDSPFGHVNLCKVEAI